MIFLSGKGRIVPYEIGLNRGCKRPKISYENGLDEEVPLLANVIYKQVATIPKWPLISTIFVNKSRFLNHHLYIQLNKTTEWSPDALGTYELYVRATSINYTCVEHAAALCFAHFLLLPYDYYCPFRLDPALLYLIELLLLQ